MLKNILLQFTDRYNTCVYCRIEDKLSVCIKTTPSWSCMTWSWISESTFSSKISSHKSWKIAQLSKMVCNNNILQTVQRFGHNALSPEFPDAVSSLNLFEAPSLLREYLIIFLWFLNHRVFHKFIQFKGCVKSASYHFFALIVSPRTNWRAWPCAAMCPCVKRARDSISFIFSKKAHLKGFPKKRAHCQKNLGGGTLLLPPLFRRACVISCDC